MPTMANTEESLAGGDGRAFDINNNAMMTDDKGSGLPSVFIDFANYSSRPWRSAADSNLSRITRTKLHASNLLWGRNSGMQGLWMTNNWGSSPKMVAAPSAPQIPTTPALRW